MSAARPEDTERDPWLSEALRHAPDAQAAPPSALSDAILRQARAATRSAGVPEEPRRMHGLAAAWAWLARPPVAAGFASVMVATVVGLMWWDQPLDQTLERPPAAAATPAPAAPTAPAPAPTVSPSPPAGEAADATAKRESRAPERKLAAPKPAEQERARAATPPVPVSPQARAAPEREAPAPAPFREDRSAADAAPAPAAEVAAAPAIAPAPAPAAVQRLREAPTMSGAAAADARDESRAATAGALTRNAAKATSAAARPPALVALLASVDAQPERWTWQRAGAPQPMNPALQRWFAQLDTATVGRWHGAGAPGGDGAALRLYRDGVLAATLRLEDEAVWFAPASQATLPRSAVAALKQALDQAAP